jgi:isopenicillin-N N-acyltransferase-like protein
VDEIRGLAEGARVHFGQALAVQIRGELGQVTEGGCTTFVIAGLGTATGQILIGQNSDVEPEHEPLGYMLHLQPVGKPELLMWTFGGQIGYHGMNSVGVAHFANSLGGGPAWQLGLPHYPVKRMMLERRTLADILTLFQQAVVCSNGNYVLCDGDGQIADIELTPSGFEVMKDRGQGFLVHTNHYLCGVHACPANHRQSLPDSFSRQTRIEQLVAGKIGTITVEDMKQFLSDHEGFPTSICRHPHDGPDHPSVTARGKTTASLIAEPEAGRIHVAKGNPCQAQYATYELD